MTKEELIAEYNNKVQICLLVEDAARHRYCCEACPRFDPATDWEGMDRDWGTSYMRIQEIASELRGMGVGGFDFVEIMRPYPFTSPPPIQRLR